MARTRTLALGERGVEHVSISVTIALLTLLTLLTIVKISDVKVSALLR